MLFTTAVFAFAYLPLVLAGYFVLGARSPRAAAAWLFAASLFFYGYWMPQYTALLLASVAINFVLGQRIAQTRPLRRWLVAGLVFNLALLSYYKYANFFVDNLQAVLGHNWQVARTVLPIGISFFTFTQIAYLVDTWAGKVSEHRPLHYGLFVTYFPHLIAGPVLHHAQMMPQFADPAVYRLDRGRLVAGSCIFCIGLAKKIVLADGIAPYADAVFGAVDAGSPATLSEAWLGALAYTFQLYFDFSGYSDMAIGLSWMFNIRLPFNFDSPYKATSVVDFWRRWHMSLSTFLRDYLYVPMGGSRHGSFRRYVNLGVTMVLGGLWHGASWSFVLWGALHGGYLMVNNAFRTLMQRAGAAAFLERSLVFAVLGWALTFVGVVAAWVLFRAETLHGAGALLHAMAGGGAGSSVDALLWNAGLQASVGAGWCCVLGLIAVGLPNSNAIGERLLAVAARWRWRSIAAGAAALTLTALLIVTNASRSAVSAFIYFNF